MKNFKKIFLSLTILISIFFAYSIELVSAWETVTQQDMRVGDGGGKLGIGGGSGVDLKDNFIRTAMNYVMGIVFIVAVGVFIYIGFELATAEGKQEKFTKGLKGLVYAGVGLAIIPLAFILVKIATGFSF
ncbi:MAG: hypothetical protein PHZ26_05805 [Candidatus Gracilibacteria bacterium]|nr:hypothetical protein [Candidatus Gracilibacteria bacterium]MDD2909227.1 hypothetical protein [Candidatus Gracilibacteria bacterium]